MDHVNRPLQRILFTELHIIGDYNHRRSSDKIRVQWGRLFGKKIVIFLRFSSVILIFFYCSNLFRLLIHFTKK